MNTQQLESWKAIIPTLGDKYREVIQAMVQLNGNATLFEISSKTGKQIHCVSGRISELKDKKIIFATQYRRINPTSLRFQTVWMLNHERLEAFLEGLKK